MGVYPYSLYQIASISLPDTLKYRTIHQFSAAMALIPLQEPTISGWLPYHERTVIIGRADSQRAVSGLLGKFDCLGRIKVEIFQINSIHTRSKIINHVIFSRFRNIKNNLPKKC